MSHHPDFANLDRHMFRTGYNTLLDLPLVLARGARVWVATIWPDPNQPGGWGRLVWQSSPTGRGWLTHSLTHLGDVIEFGADHDGLTDRWYGYFSTADDYTLIVVGPYENPAETEADGRASLLHWEQATLDRQGR